MFVKYFNNEFTKEKLERLDNVLFNIQIFAIIIIYL